MNFLSIEYFAAVASEHSFSKAAKRLGITQQTLSANIAALERELGCTLFVRHVPLELTYAGTVFARYAQRFRRDRDHRQPPVLEQQPGREPRAQQQRGDWR